MQAHKVLEYMHRKNGKATRHGILNDLFKDDDINGINAIEYLVGILAISFTKVYNEPGYELTDVGNHLIEKSKGTPEGNL